MLREKDEQVPLRCRPAELIQCHLVVLGLVVSPYRGRGLCHLGEETLALSEPQGDLARRLIAERLLDSGLDQASAKVAPFDLDRAVNPVDIDTIGQTDYQAAESGIDANCDLDLEVGRGQDCRIDTGQGCTKPEPSRRVMAARGDTRLQYAAHHGGIGENPKPWPAQATAGQCRPLPWHPPPAAEA